MKVGENVNNLTRKMLKPLDFIFNHGLKDYCLGPHAVEIIGAKGVGKSTIFALVGEMAKKRGMKVFSQYPYEGCYQIPVIEEDQGRYVIKGRHKLSNGKYFEDKVWIPHKVWTVDKDWLYNN